MNKFENHWCVIFAMILQEIVTSFCKLIETSNEYKLNNESFRMGIRTAVSERG